LERGGEGIDWIDVPQDRDKWRALVNAAMNLQFHKMLGNSQEASHQWPLK
jgi:hypothetical protein